MSGACWFGIGHARLFPSPHRADRSDLSGADVPDLRRDPPGAGRSGRGQNRRARHVARAAGVFPPSARPRPAGVAAVPSLCLASRARDFGVSLSSQRSVLAEFLTLFPATLELSFFAMLF